MPDTKAEAPRREDAVVKPKNKYMFPDAGMTVEADTLAEAQEIFKKLSSNQ